MKITSLRRSRNGKSAGVTGPARLDRRTRSVVRRVRRGDIAVIDHVDMDRSAAVALVDAGVAAVVNVAPSISGRYPNLGPEVLVRAGVPLLDDVGADAFAAVDDGDIVRVDADTLYVGDTAVASGVRHDVASVAAAMESARAGMGSQLEAFSANAVEHLRRDQGMLLDGEGVPSMRSSFHGRTAVVVTKAFDYATDLRRLKRFVKESKPVLIGVDGGADVLIAAGYRPDVVVSSADAVETASDTALRSGAEVIAHVPASTGSGAVERLERLGVKHQSFAASGTSEDAAILLAHVADADLIVTVGSHGSLVEFLDKGRSGMASSFLTRTSVGSHLVDAKAVAQLYEHRVRGWLMLLMMLVAVAAVVAALATTPVGQEWFDDARAGAAEAWDWARGLGS